MDTLHSKEQRIIAAAEQVFSKHGFEKATVDEIIALADVGKGTLYKYFGNKEQLFYQLVCNKNLLFVERLDAAVAHSQSLEQKMIAYLTEMITFYRTNASLWQIICFEMLGSSNGCIVKTINGVPTVVSRYQTPPSAEVTDTILRYHKLLAAEFNILQRLFEEGMQNGQLKKGDSEIATMYVFFGMAMSIFHAHASIDTMAPQELAKITVDRVLHGMA